MTTKVYFHAETHGLSGTLPTAEQDTQAADFTATNANTLRGMSRAPGSAMVNQQGTTVATVSNQAGFIGHWTTGPLSGAQTVGGVGETLALNFAAYESNLSANLNFRFHVYVWRPSTGAIVGDCCSYATVPSDTTAEPGAASSIRVATAIVDLAAVAASDGDVPIVEVWTNTTQAAATAYTVRMYYDGTTENTTENAVVTDHASFIEFSQNLVFQSPTARLSNQSAVVLYETTTPASARLSNQSVVVLYIPLEPYPNLYHDASGQLVIADSMPDGGSVVYAAENNDLDKTSPWYRDLDSVGGETWHPAKYYDGGREAVAQIPGGNIMPNSDMGFGVDYWEILDIAGGGTNYTGPALDLSANAPVSSHSVGVSRTGTTLAASDTFDIIYSRGVNVLPDTPYEVSAYLAATNCAASIFVNFYKLVADVETLISSSNVTGDVTSAGGEALSGWTRAGAVVTTPSDCQYLKFVVRGGAATADDPVFWAAKLFVGQAYAGQTQLSPWTSGGNSGAYGELNQLSDSHDETVTTISVPDNTITTVISLTFTSIISPSRTRKLLVVFAAESGTLLTRLIRVDLTSGSYSDQKAIYESTINMDSRFLSFASILSIPSGYDADVTIEVQIKQNAGASRDYQNISLSAIELPT